MTSVGTMRCPDPSHMTPMVKRRNRATGEVFYGCVEWPDCPETRPIPQAELLRAIGAPELPGFESEGAN